jgi:large subunit ribosomal protein L31e
MAKKDKKPEVKLERVYNVPLRKEWLKVPKYRRAKKALTALKQFLAKHMKADISNVKIEKYANLKVWERGMKNPPHHIKVIAKKDDTGVVRAELEGAPVEKKKEIPKKAEKKPAEKKPEEKKPKAKPEEKKKEEPVKEEKPAEKKEEVKEAKPEEKIEEPKPEKTEKEKEVEQKVEELEKQGSTSVKANKKPAEKKE